MNALSPDLGMYVAEQTIIKRFKISDKEHRQLWNLAEFCKLEPEDIPALLEKGDRRLTGPTMPPQGLYLNRVWYPDPVGTLFAHD